MSTLNALKLLRDFNAARRAAEGEGEKPRLVMLWTIDAASGRPVGTWVALEGSPSETQVREPALG